MAAEKYHKPCIDSSVFIAALGGEICNGIKRRTVFTRVWEQAKAGEFPVYIAAITLAEVYKKKERTRVATELLDEFFEYINEPFVEVVQVDYEVGKKAHDLCREYHASNLYPNDAIHLACALRAGCDVLLAWDAPLVNVVHPRILIEEPRILNAGLFHGEEFATPEEIVEYAVRTEAEKRAIHLEQCRLATESSLLARDAFADKIADLHRSGELPTPFSSKHVRDKFGKESVDYNLNEVLPDYCDDGKQVRRGRLRRFERVSRGNYISVVDLLNENKTKTD